MALQKIRRMRPFALFLSAPVRLTAAIAAAVLASAGAQNAAFVPTHKDVAYASDHPAQILDVYLAESDKPTPVMVYIHGGGWRAGSKASVPNYLRAGFLRGWFSVVAVEYRFTDVATHPAQVHDCARAIQFIRHKAAEWNLDPEKIGAAGGSAGGHLSLWLALHDDLAKPDSADPIERQSSRLTCAVSYAGPTDWALLGEIPHAHPAYRQLLGHEPGTEFAAMDAEKVAGVSPITHVSRDDPPVLLVHGTEDTIVPIQHAKKLHAAIQKAKGRSQLLVIEGANHGMRGGNDPTQAVSAFIRRNLIPRSKPSGKTTLSAETPELLQTHENLTYATYGERSLQLDLYRPKTAAPAKLPGVICIHGGGWAKGNRTSHANLAKALAARGFVAATISYRLSGEAPFPAAIHDCKAAVRWMRANAETYGIDAANIGAIGLSAGGHLTALLATSGGVAELEGAGGNPEFSSEIQAAVPLGAQTDLMAARILERSKTAEIYRQFLGGSQEERAETYRLASPLTHLDAADPPIVFLAGEFDDPSTRAELFRSKMGELGLETGFTELSGGPHAFLGGQNWFGTCTETASAFFARNLR